MSGAMYATSYLGRPEGIGALRRQRLHWARLYFVCDARPHDQDPEPLLRAALANGAGMIELREKALGKPALREVADRFRRLADDHSALFIVNDDPHFAVEVGADGVHVGQDDMAVDQVREIVGPDAIVGLSTHSREQIEAANETSADYISVGPLWETPTKEGRPASGLRLLGTAGKLARMPFFAIGGIDASNVDRVLKAGAERICVVRAIRDADDPGAAASALRAPLDARAAELKEKAVG